MTYYQYPKYRKPSPRKQRKKLPFFNRERAVNPDTGKPFRDPRSKIVAGRVICKGADMADLRRRTGEREGELCQVCEEWAPIYPPESQIPGEMHHIRGRGLGGGKRNDILSEQEWLCRNCHRARKIEPGYGLLGTEGAA